MSTPISIPSRRPLYEIASEYRGLEELLESAESLEDPGLHAAIMEHFRDTKHEIALKADNYVALIKIFEQAAKGRKEEGKRMVELAKVEENRAARIKASLLKALQGLSVVKLDTPRFKITVKDNSSVPVEIDEDAQLPPRFLRTVVTTEVDKTSLALALAAGEVIPGVRLGERGQHLLIK